jgi:uncharacterized coiled-coil protein SlyX
MIMSVHQESLEIGKPAERMEEAPELEYRAVSHDSLSMFLAAIGGAILGMLLTLLILALINGGTLSFSGGQRLAVFEATLDRVNQNVGSVSTNVDLVSQQAQAVVDQLSAVEKTLRAEMASQESDIENLNTAVSQLDVTRQQFDLFMGALGQAMSEMQTLAQPAARTAPAPVAAAPAPAAALPAPTVITSADVEPNALLVLLFVDGNGNGAFDTGEIAIDNASVVLTGANGRAIASERSTGDGIHFADLSAGVYTLTVDDAAGHELLTSDQAQVTVTADASAGQAVYIPVAAK